MEKLTKTYWEERYENHQTGWDIGSISLPLETYFTQLTNKNTKILIPGCGNGHEAEFLINNGFKNTYVIDLAAAPLKNLAMRCSFPKKNIFNEDFFEFENDDLFDLIVEQTMFCAIDPMLRKAYIAKVAHTLKKKGKYVGLLFNKIFESGPPFGGTQDEYYTLLKPYFSKIEIDPCYNSIPQRQGSELFIRCVK